MYICTFRHWYICTFGHWYICTFGHWYICTFRHWYICTFRHKRRYSIGERGATSPIEERGRNPEHFSLLSIALWAKKATFVEDPKG